MTTLKEIPASPADCDYYKGVGTCYGGVSCGYFGEPRCITDEPEHGWDGKREVGAG